MDLFLIKIPFSCSRMCFYVFICNKIIFIYNSQILSNHFQFVLLYNIACGLHFDNWFSRFFWFCFWTKCSISFNRIYRVLLYLLLSFVQFLHLQFVITEGDICIFAIFLYWRGFLIMSVPWRPISWPHASRYHLTNIWACWDILNKWELLFITFIEIYIC